MGIVGVKSWWLVPHLWAAEYGLADGRMLTMSAAFELDLLARCCVWVVFYGVLVLGANCLQNMHIIRKHGKD